MRVELAAERSHKALQCKSSLKARLHRSALRHNDSMVEFMSKLKKKKKFKSEYSYGKRIDLMTTNIYTEKTVFL